MATYKVLQDIEAEDKLIGPLTLRQSIYGFVTLGTGYLCFMAVTRGAPFLLVLFLPIFLVSGFFAFPWKGEQPTEIWALARLRFNVKPRVRIWNQDGMKQLVTVTAPRRVSSRPQPRNLSQNEVQSRLKALADTIDTRGWATRNANYQYYSRQQRGPSDRLVNASGLRPDAIPMDAFLPSNDMMDDQNPVAQNLDAMLAHSQQQQRQRVMQEIAQAQSPVPPAPSAQATPSPQLPAPAIPGALPADYGAAPAPTNAYWFAGGPAYPGGTQPGFTPGAMAMPPQGGAIPAAEPTAAEVAFARRMMRQNQLDMQINYGHMRVLQPLSEAAGTGNDLIDYGTLPGSNGVAPAAAMPQLPDPLAPPAAAAEPVTRQPDPAILELANNDDLDVATLARQASREIRKSPDEVEIRLH